MKESVNTSKSGDGSSAKINKVKVCLVLGHTASRREEITSDEKTHDWRFYVKGEPGAKVERFIDRVIFTLHESFPNPVQTIKQPPYEIIEQGYGTFLMQVEVKFKNKRSPKNIHYKYDLLLPGPGVAPIKKSRKEILTFTNPNPEFMAKLLEGGGQLLTYFYDADGNLVNEADVPAKKENPKTEKVQKIKETSSLKEKVVEKERKIKKLKNNKDDSSEYSNRKNVGNSEKKRSSEQLKPKENKKESPKPLASILASIGDIESSDEDDKEKYFKDLSPKVPFTESKPAMKSKDEIRKKPKHKQPKPNPETSFLEFDNLESLKQTKKSSKHHKKETINQKRKKFIKDMSDDETYPKEKVKKTVKTTDFEIKKPAKTSETDLKKTINPMESELKRSSKSKEANPSKTVKYSLSDTKSNKPNKCNEFDGSKVLKSKEPSIKAMGSASESDVKTPLSDIDPDETAKWFQSPDSSEPKQIKKEFPVVTPETPRKSKKNKHKICKQPQAEASPLSPQSSLGSPKEGKSNSPNISTKLNEEEEEENGEVLFDTTPLLPMTDEEIILRLTVYQKIALLQETSNKTLLSEVVNLIEDEIISFGDGRITFDLLKCDIKTLKAIDGMLSG